MILRELETVGGVLTIFMPTGQRKHDRHFKVCTADGTILWDKQILAGTDSSQTSPSKQTRKNAGRNAGTPRKSGKVVAVHEGATVQDGAL
eukprot:COSAG02_NODE_1318_length_13293_cov_39.414886_11_plen_90_part_00